MAEHSPTRQWLTYLRERPYPRRGAPGRTFDVYLATSDVDAWLELEEAGRETNVIVAGLMDLANEHRPEGVLRVRVERMVFGVLVGEDELGRLRRVVAQHGHRDVPPGPRVRRSPLAA